MTLEARDVMTPKPDTVAPDMSLLDLARKLLEGHRGGFPVVEQDGRLCGVVSRSDVLRQLGVEESRAEVVAEFYHDWTGFSAEGPARAPAIAAREAGGRLSQLRVRDVMTRVPIAIGPDASLHDAARELTARRIHRLPVVDGERLVGIVTAVDLVRAIAEERL